MKKLRFKIIKHKVVIIGYFNKGIGVGFDIEYSNNCLSGAFLFVFVTVVIEIEQLKTK